MVFISLKLYEAGGTFILDSKLAFKKIKMTDATFSTNNLDASIDNVLVCLEKYNTNQFIFQSRTSQAQNTLYLADVPVIKGTPFSFSPVAMSPPDYQDEETQFTRYLKFQIKKDNGEQLSNAEWGSSVCQLILNFE